MKTYIGILGLLLFTLVGCDTATEEPVDDCPPGEWRLCVTDTLSWGRRWCTASGWGTVCEPPECAPADVLDCTTACGTPGTRLCEADGFWGVCNHEVCDGVDNDCDGRIDEELVKHCQCGCADGESWCVEGVWTACAGDWPGSCTVPPDGCDGGLIGRPDLNEGKTTKGNEKARRYDPSKP